MTDLQRAKIVCFAMVGVYYGLNAVAFALIQERGLAAVSLAIGVLVIIAIALAARIVDWLRGAS